MIKGNLLLVPSGGLANRMRAIASAHILAKKTGSSLQVVWFKEKNILNAHFFDLFQPIDSNMLKIREANLADYLLNQPPRKRNLWLTSIPQFIIYDKRLDENQTFECVCNKFNFKNWISGNNCYMVSYKDIMPVTDGLYLDLFKPQSKIQKDIDAFTNRFSSHTVGFHIRRTDHVAAIQNSPIELFIEAADKEILTHDDTKLFLASDSTEVKDIFKKRYGNRLITNTKKTSRDSASGISDGITDMWSLASTKKIYGSCQSTFSIAAAQIGSVPIDILSLHD